MDTDFTETQARYRDFLENTPPILTDSLSGVKEEDRQTARNLLSGSKRIIFTAAGSSIPAALYGVYMLQQEGMPASYLPTGSILGLASLSASDLVILCSQGMNRADASLVVTAVKSRGARLIVFTANRNTPLTASADLTVYFDPENEKLFCRPTGVATNLAVVASLLSENLIAADLVKAWQEGQKQATPFSSQTRYITLASDMMLPANWNMALAVREGCGILAQNFDIETYAHGNYVGDLTVGTFDYIVLSADDSTESARSVRRITPFLTGTKVPTHHIQAPFKDAARANLYVLGFIAQATYMTNEANQYNMNKPFGKEENRYYHELESYDG